MDHSWPLGVIYFVYSLRGISVSASYLFPLSILPDVIEYYFAIYEDRREASFYSMMSFVEKSGIAVSFITSALILGFTGYENPTTAFEKDEFQPDSAVFALRFLVSICPMFYTVLASLFGCFYFFAVQRRKDRYSGISDELFSDYSYDD